MKVLVVDDHALIRDALRSALAELVDDVTVLDAADCRQAMELIAAHADLALILLDLSLPDRDGFDVLADVRRRHPAVAVVVLSALSDRERVRKALDLGALGFIPKNARREVTLRALQLVLSGGIYIPPEILGREEKPQAEERAPAAVSPSDLGLTGRQLEVLALMMQGKSNKAICRALELAESTVKNHVTALLKALKASNRTEAVIAAGALGWDLSRAKP
jgi:DNA-binding NarL/FixJ family response regulator